MTPRSQKPLWPCPACGRAFANANQSHACGRYELEDHFAGKPPLVCSAQEAENALQETIRGWRAWAKTTALPSFAPEAVLRSALCLKLHAYIDTGAIIAAATTSLPEALGSGRTWDYRFCWLRDAAFVVEALRRLSHLSEGEAFVRFLREMADAGPLQLIYGISGKRDLRQSEDYRQHGREKIGAARSFAISTWRFQPEVV